MIAIPVGLAGDLDRLVELRQAGRGQHHLRRQLMLPEQAAAGGADMGRRDQQRHRAMPPQPGEINQPDQQVAQRVDPQRVELVGREQVSARSSAKAPIPPSPIELPRPACPIACQTRSSRCPGTFAAALAPAPGQGHSVDRPGRGAAHRGDVEPGLLEQPVEHAPGEGAVRAATLQRQADLERGARRWRKELIIDDLRAVSAAVPHGPGAELMECRVVIADLTKCRPSRLAAMLEDRCGPAYPAGRC